VKVEIRTKKEDFDDCREYKNVSTTCLTEKETFYVISFKDKSQLNIATDTILWFQETPEEGDDDIF
jgi:hypothetical protein